MKNIQSGPHDNTRLEKKQIKPSGQVHTLDSNIAKSLGINAGIIYDYLKICLETSSCENKKYIDEQIWIRKSAEEMSVYLKYFTKKQIRKALQLLIKFKIIFQQNLNEDKFDKTMWYTINNSKEV